MSEIIKSIVAALMSGLIILFIQRQLDKKDSKEEKVKKDNFIRNTALITAATEILAVIFTGLSVYFYCNNNSSLFSIFFVLAVICFEYSFISLYGLFAASKIFLDLFHGDQDSEKKPDTAKPQ